MSQPTDAAPPRPRLFTVAVCTRNRAVFLREAVASVVEQIDDDTQVLIVDNASTDNTPQVAAELAAAHPSVRVVLESRLGLSHGRNTALAQSDSRYVIFIDDDAVAEPGWLAAYRRFFSNPPAPDIVAAGSVVIPRYDVTPPRWLAPGENELKFAASACPMTGRGLPWGGNFACDRVRAIEAGGFGVHLGRRGASMGAHEETDLLHRLRASGFSVWWLPDAPIRHHVAAHRLRLRFYWAAAWAAGRSVVAVRLRQRSGRWRQCGLVAGRLLAAPIQSLMYLVLALVTAPFQDGRLAAKAIAGAVRTVGMLWQLLVETPRILAGETCSPARSS